MKLLLIITALLLSSCSKPCECDELKEAKDFLNQTLETATKEGSTKEERRLLLAEYSDCIDEWKEKQGIDAHEVCKYILELE